MFSVVSGPRLYTRVTGQLELELKEALELAVENE
jgi:hypothetical protein